MYWIPIIKAYQPTSYNDIIGALETSSGSLQRMLFNFELTRLATHIKYKFNDDTRSIEELANVIIEELLDGRWDYKLYLSSKTKRTSA